VRRNVGRSHEDSLLTRDATYGSAETSPPTCPTAGHDNIRRNEGARAALWPQHGPATESDILPDQKSEEPSREDVGQNENPSRVPGFVLFEQRGEGGFGEVYRAEDQSPFKTTVAIKIITPHPLMVDSNPHERFLREAEALRRLTPHRGIVRYLASGWTMDKPPLPYLAMDFIDGVRLLSSH